MGTPVLTVIIPVYNGERFLGAAIESVLHQTFQDYELIVVDDGSTDKTSNVVDAYKGRLKFLTQSNSGQASARNLGFRCSSGEYLAFLDADDLWYPNMLETEVMALEENPKSGLVYSDLDIIDENAKVVEQNLSRLSRGPIPFSFAQAPDRF